MSKLVLNTHLVIVIPVALIIGFSGCSSVTSERKLPVIGDINLPFVSEGKKVPAIVINRQDRFKKLPVPPSGFITVQKGDTIYSIVNRYDVTPYKLISENKSINVSIKKDGDFYLISGTIEFLDIIGLENFIKKNEEKLLSYEIYKN